VKVAWAGDQNWDLLFLVYFFSSLFHLEGRNFVQILETNDALAAIDKILAFIALTFHLPRNRYLTPMKFCPEITAETDS
jgi:hypothetical protein